MLFKLCRLFYRKDDWIYYNYYYLIKGVISLNTCLQTSTNIDLTKDCGNAECFKNIDLFCANSCFSNVNCGVSGFFQNSMCLINTNDFCTANCVFCYKSILDIYTSCRPPQLLSEDPCFNGNISYTCNSNYFSCKCVFAISFGRYNLVCSGPTIINNIESDIWVINPGLTTSK